MDENVTKPVTVKIRIVWDEENINRVEIAKYCEQAGAQAIAVHARTRNQFYSGKDDWNWIMKVKENFAISVIGNGDVFTCENEKRMLKETGCDTIMLARRVQGNTWVFKQIQHFLDTGEKI